MGTGAGAGSTAQDHLRLGKRPRRPPGGNVLDAQLDGSGQQGGKTCIVAAAQYLGGLVCQCFCLQYDALDAKSLGSLPCGCCPSALVSGQLYYSPGHAKALLLQNAHNNAATSWP